MAADNYFAIGMEFLNNLCGPDGLTGIRAKKRGNSHQEGPGFSDALSDGVEAVAEMFKVMKQGKGRSVGPAVKGSQIGQFLRQFDNARFRGGQRIQNLNAKAGLDHPGSDTGQSVWNGAFGRQIKIANGGLDEQDIAFEVLV